MQNRLWTMSSSAVCCILVHHVLIPIFHPEIYFTWSHPQFNCCVYYVYLFIRVSSASAHSSTSSSIFWTLDPPLYLLYLNLSLCLYAINVSHFIFLLVSVARRYSILSCFLHYFSTAECISRTAALQNACTCLCAMSYIWEQQFTSSHLGHIFSLGG